MVNLVLEADGDLEEVSTDAGGHLERLDDGDWFLSLQRLDGSSVAIWITGDVTLWEVRDPPKCPECQENIPAKSTTDVFYLLCPQCGWSASPNHKPPKTPDAP